VLLLLEPYPWNATGLFEKWANRPNAGAAQEGNGIPNYIPYTICLESAVSIPGGTALLVAFGTRRTALPR
jgi:hypothetical protein